MCYYNTEQFKIFMWSQFGIEVDEEKVGEESILLYKEELDENLVPKSFFEFTPELVLVHSYSYETKDKEWVVSMVSDADTNYPLFLICLNDGVRVHEEILSDEGGKNVKAE